MNFKIFQILGESEWKWKLLKISVFLISETLKSSHLKVQPSIEENAFFGLTNLKTLSLEDCGITDLKKNTFRNLKKLENLSLSPNYLRTLDFSLTENENLIKIDLRYNQICFIKKTFLTIWINYKEFIWEVTNVFRLI